MTTHHLPISIPDILHGKTVEWERSQLKAGLNCRGNHIRHFH